MNWRAEELRSRFAVFGRFYEAVLDGRRRELRSHLEVFERALAWPDAATADADLIAIMMNPGASRPLESPDRDGWAITLPDRTQYQLMRLALYAQSKGRRMRHIRVINLSDLRTPKSEVLFEVLRALGDDRHSIFSRRRRAELERALGTAPTPVLRAWGMAPALEALAIDAIESTSDRRVLGLTHDNLHYRHPLPQRADLQAHWLAEASRQIDGLE